jgi:hypothetical protein
VSGSVPTVAPRISTLGTKRAVFLCGGGLLFLREVPTTHTTLDNSLLDTLRPHVRDAVAGSCERVRLGYRAPIYELGGPINFLYFPIDAVISVVTVMRNGTQIEVVTIGREGSDTSGASSPSSTGSALRRRPASAIAPTTRPSPGGCTPWHDAAHHFIHSIHSAVCKVTWC